MLSCCELDRSQASRFRATDVRPRAGRGSWAQERPNCARTGFRQLIWGTKQGKHPIRASARSIQSCPPCCNNFPTVALKGPDRDVRLDNSRTSLSGGGGKSSAERGSGLDSCGTGGWGGAAPTGNARHGRLGKFGQARLQCPVRAGTVVRAAAGPAGAMTGPGLLAG